MIRRVGKNNEDELYPDIYLSRREVLEQYIQRDSDNRTYDILMENLELGYNREGKIFDIMINKKKLFKFIVHSKLDTNFLKYLNKIITSLAFIYIGYNLGEFINEFNH